jgi:hypothetical protein
MARLSLCRRLSSKVRISHTWWHLLYWVHHMECFIFASRRFSETSREGNNPGVVVHTYNSSTREADRKIMSSR